jgi:hypothetical protein
MGRPKCFRTVGAMSTMDRADTPKVSRRATGRLEIKTPAVVAAS